MKVKNFFRTLLAVMVAVIMSFSVAIFAGCEDDEEASTPPASSTPESPDNSNNSGNSNNSSNSNNQSNPDNTGNSDNTGNTDNTGKPDKPDKPGNPGESTGIVGSTAEITALLNAMATQETLYAGVNASVTMAEGEERYSVDESGAKLEDYTYSYQRASDIGVSAKFNVETGDGDISYSESVEVSEADEDDRAFAEYFYAFLRNWNLFTLAEYDENGDSVEVTDFSDKTLYWDGNIEETYGGGFAESEYGEEVIGALEALIGGEFTITGAAESLFVPSTGFTTAYVADSLGAFTLKSGKATADFNKAAYNLVQQIKGVLNSINTTTTLGKVLENDTVKSLIETFTVSVAPAEVKTYINTYIEQLKTVEIEGGMTVGDMLEAMEIDVASYIVDPDENSTVYEYIVKIVKSNELKNLVNKILKAAGEASGNKIVITLPFTLDKIYLDYILNYAGTSLDQIKTAFNEFTKDITETEFKITITNPVHEIFDEDQETVLKTLNIPSTTTVTLKNLKVEYTLNGNAVTEIKISDVIYSLSNNYIKEIGYHREQEEIEIFSIIYCEEQSSATVKSASCTLSSNAYTLEDINENEVVYNRYEWTEEQDGQIKSLYIRPYDMGLEDEDLEVAVIKATLEIEDGEVKGVSLSSENGDDIQVDENGKFTVSFKNYETQATVTAQLYLNMFEDEGALRIYLTARPVTNVASYDSYNEAVARNAFYMEGIMYGNTVKGILNGTPGTKLEDDEI